MKIVLIQPPGWSVDTPPYSLALLKAALKNRTHQAICLDLNIELYEYVEETLRKDIWSSTATGNCCFDREFVLGFIEKYRPFIDEFLSKVINLNPDVIGFTVINRSAIFVLEIAKMIKAKEPEKKIILGGAQAYRNLRGLNLIKESSVDAVCLGEGELCLGNLLDIIEKKNGIEFCKGFIYKNKDNKFIDCGDPEINEDLDSLAFADFSDFNLARYKMKRLPILTAKGCVYKCSFCNETVWMRKFRSRTANNIYSEINFQLSKYPHIKEFQFCDSLINGNIKMLNELCDLIIKDNIHINWNGQASIRKEMTKDFLMKLKKAGCMGLSYGIESGSNRILRLMNKPFTAELAEEVLRNSYEAGIQPNFNIIVGFPGETESEFQETINFLKRNSKFFGGIFLSTVHIYGGSDLDRNRDKWGIRVLRSGEWESLDGKNNYEQRLRQLEICKNIVRGKVCDDAVSINLLTKLTKQTSTDKLGNEKISLERPASRTSIPPYCVFFSWYINNECNYHCTYCKPQDIKTRFIDVKRWIELWSEIYRKYGSCHLHLSGGEPFIYPNFIELITGLTKKHTLEFSTNLSVDIEPFIDAVGPDRVRLGGSFHPEFADFADFFKKIMLLKEKDFEVWVNYVAWPPILNKMAKYKKIVEEAGIRFSVLPFNGEFQARKYPQNYTEAEKKLLLGTSRLDDVNKETIDWRTDAKKSAVKGRLCRMGQMYARIYPDAEAYRCCGNGVLRLGNLLDGTFRLLEEPLSCESENCPCHKCMLVGTEDHWLRYWTTPGRLNLKESEMKHPQIRRGRMIKEELNLKIKELFNEDAGKKFKVKYRRLGKTNLMVSEVGLGGHDWGLDGKPGIGTPEYRKERLEVIKKALDLGVNFTDTTNNYEGETLGKRLKQLNVRGEFIISYGDSDNFVTKADEAYIRGLAERQLKLLGVDAIDIFMVFDFPIGIYAQENNLSVENEIEKISQILEKLKREGKIRFSCYGTHENENLRWAGKADIGNLFDTIQINFNFFESGPLKNIIPYAKEHDMGIIVMTPFRKGTLLNKYWGGDQPRDKDLKKPDDPIFENLKEKELGLDWALLKYVISVKDISMTIPGVANREQLVRNLATSIFRNY